MSLLLAFLKSGAVESSGQMNVCAGPTVYALENFVRRLRTLTCPVRAVTFDTAMLKLAVRCEANQSALTAVRSSID